MDGLEALGADDVGGITAAHVQAILRPGVAPGRVRPPAPPPPPMSSPAAGSPSGGGGGTPDDGGGDYADAGPEAELLDAEGTSDLDDGAVDVGHGHGGHGGHGHHGGGRRRGWWGGGPWWWGDGYDLLDAESTEEDLDTVAQAVAQRLKKQHRTLVGAYDIGKLQLQMNSLKQVTVAIGRALVKHGLQVASETITIAEGGLFQRALPVATTLKNLQGHLQWHADELAKQSDPTALYGSSDDLKKWVVEAFIDANGVEEGRARQEQIWSDMWTEIGDELAKLPATLAQTVAAVPRALIEGATGIPMWAFWVGGLVVAGLLGFGVWKLLTLAAPIAARRYLP